MFSSLGLGILVFVCVRSSPPFPGPDEPSRPVETLHSCRHKPARLLLSVFVEADACGGGVDVEELLRNGSRERVSVESSAKGGWVFF